MAATPKDSTPTTVMYSLYSAVEGIKDYTMGTNQEFENDGDLNALIEQLGWIRDRAIAVQNAAIGTRDALSENL